MKRIGSGRFSMLVSVLIALALLACACFALWGAVTGRHSSGAVLAAAGIAPGQEQPLYWLSVFAFGAGAGYMLGKLWKGVPYLLYDETGATFVLSRGDSRIYRWEALRAFGVTVRDLGEIEPPGLPIMRGFFFRFPDGKRFPVRRMHRGYEDLRDLLIRRGLASGLR